MVHSQSTVELLDHMGDDLSAVNAARVSFDMESASLTEKDINLLDYLIREVHNTPIEQIEFKFRITCPLPIGEQIIRHRTASVNKISLRYVEYDEEEYFLPPVFRKQSSDNKQGSAEDFDAKSNAKVTKLYQNAVTAAFKSYNQAIKLGMAKEMARFLLPTCTMTKFIWKIDLHNLLHFLKLRLDSHAQKEVRDIAQAILKSIEPIVPNIVKIWEKHVYKSLTLSSHEAEIAFKLFSLNPELYEAQMNVRDARIFKDKLTRFNEIKL
jgi:thymidylate synthase (FAD)